MHSQWSQKTGHDHPAAALIALCVTRQAAHLHGGMVTQSTMSVEAAWAGHASVMGLAACQG